ncbi:NAD(P)-dependent oxidoreductase [Phreatobacter aquaticus]|uniref:NAD(P)-dependent oxidoreductase n=1 Tax=Phreatobacter aquaticus TaxID=2570229 RepID=A0A4D7QPD0_9HYPH|nr:NAD(P)-dependent oxidoreductase [Phreatobacter aquaticus]QCK87436.1 NAD(P)-dependent oxidoreductase [Phreatobacter aquaticus]
MTAAGSDDLAGHTVLVAGGRGFVGSHVVRALVSAGARPVVFGPPMADDLLADITGHFDDITGSVEDDDALDQVFATTRPPLVISCIAHGAGKLGLMRTGEADLQASLAVNVAGFAKLLDAARRAHVRRVVWTSSTVVYGPASAYGGRTVNEADATGPVTNYGLTKELAETVAAYHHRRHGLHVVGLRLPLVLGPGLWYQGVASTIAGLFATIREGRAAHIAFHDDAMDLMEVGDVARALLIAAQHPRKLDPIYNLAGFTAAMSDIVAAVSRLRPDARITRDLVPAAQTFPPIDGRRFSQATGFTATHDLDSLVASLLTPEAETAHV